MRPHAKAVGNRLEDLLFLVDAAASPPPPRLVHEWPVSRVHQPDNAVVDAARQVSKQLLPLVGVAEDRQSGRRLPSRPRPRMRHVYPDVAVMLLGRKALRADTSDVEILVGHQRRDLMASSGMAVKLPAVIRALDQLAVEPALGERHSAMRTTVTDNEYSPLLIAAYCQRNSQQHRALKLARFDLTASQRRVPGVEAPVRVGELGGDAPRRFRDRSVPPRLSLQPHFNRTIA